MTALAPLATRTPVRIRPVAVLYTTTAFTGAALLFLVQPMIARMLLPSYGGAATVWATCSLFFQVVLLLGYVFVHLTSRLGPRGQPLAQLPLLLLPLTVLPLALPADAVPEDSPALWLLRTLVVMVGLPFAVLSTTGPVLQRWYSWLDAPRSNDPYFLYAASNVGSFGGLLAYPFLVEPSLTLGQQRTLWSAGFVAFLLLVASCGTIAYRGHDRGRPPVTTNRPAPARMLRWVALAFVPSSLMLGVTTHVTTDVSPVPLLWVVPLAIYLATFVVAFAGARRSVPVRAAVVAVGLTVLVKLVVSFSGATPLLLTLGLTMALLGTVAYTAHALLAADRPPPDQLTLFFVLISFGGALGGLFNGLLAPLLFDRVLEFGLVLAAVPLLWAAVGATRWIALTMALALLAGAFLSRPAGDVLHRSRTFYGSYLVVDKGDRVELAHGTTVHGFQLKDPARRGEPTSYYARSGPLGDVFDLVGETSHDVTVVGLGTGTVAAYGRPGQTMRFIEIDEEVVRIARDERLFSFLADTAAQVDTVVGDGRLELAAVPPGSTDLVVLDAFSSDAIPMHLLTAEAFAEYATRMAPDGAIAVHVSNRHFDLAPVIAGAAAAIGWETAARRGRTDALAVASHWLVVSPDGGLADRLVAGSGWDPERASPGQAWTDDHASLVEVLD